jgi:hypothetical protein
MMHSLREFLCGNSTRFLCSNSTRGLSAVILLEVSLQ